jgi:hypothetical protein
MGSLRSVRSAVRKRHVALLGVIIALAVVMSSHHAGASNLAMPAMDHAAMVICLGVLAGVATGVGLLPSRRLPAWIAEPVRDSADASLRGAPPARAGPNRSFVLRL